MAAVKADLRKLLEPAVSALGFELVHMELVGTGRRGLLRVYIDSSAGVTVNDCARVSEQLSAILDVEDLIHGPYTLEVSSPGLDRPLVKPEDFSRFAGETIKVRVREPLENGQKNFKGCLVGIRGNQVMLDLGKQKLDLAFDSIEKARLIPKL